MAFRKLWTILIVYLLFSLNLSECMILKRVKNKKVTSSKIKKAKTRSESETKLSYLDSLKKSKKKKSKEFITAIIVATSFLLITKTMEHFNFFSSFFKSFYKGVDAVMGKGFELGSILISAAINAKTVELAKTQIEFYNYQLREKNRLCLSLKNLNALTDDIFELALLKIFVDVEKSKLFFSESDSLKFDKESSEYRRLINEVWKNSNYLETLICTKNIDLIGESSYIKNTLPFIDTKAFDTATFFDNFIYTQYTQTFLDIGNKFYETELWVNNANDHFDKLLICEYLTPQKMVDDILANNASFKTTLVNTFKYSAETNLDTAVFKEINNFKYSTEKTILPFTNPEKEKETCPSRGISCVLKSIESKFLSIKEMYSTTLQSSLKKLALENKKQEFTDMLYNYSVKFFFDIVFLFSALINCVEFIEGMTVKFLQNLAEESQNIEYGKVEAEFKDKLAIIAETKPSTTSVFKTLEKFFQEIILFNDDLMATKTDIKNNIEEINSMLNINFALIGITAMKNQFSIISEIFELFMKYFYLSAYNKQTVNSKGTQKSQEKSTKKDDIHISGVENTELVIEAPTTFQKVTEKIIDFTKEYIWPEIKNQIMSYLKKIPILGTVISYGLKIWGIWQKYQKLRFMDYHVQMQDMIMTSLSARITDAVEYLIPKYMIFSVGNLEKINNYVMIDQFDDKSKILQVKPSSESLAKYSQSIIGYFTKRCKENPNFFLKFFNFDIIKRIGIIDGFDQQLAFEKDLKKIYIPLLQQGPISSLLIADNNYLNFYGFVEGNPGYQMFRNIGKEFSDSNALLYCKGCFNPNHLYLSYLKTYPDIDSKKFAETFNEINSTSGSEKKLVCDLNFVDKLSEQVIEGSTDKKFTYFNACFKKVYFDDSENHEDVNLVQSLYDEINRSKTKAFNVGAYAFQSDIFNIRKDSPLKFLLTEINTICDSDESNLKLKIANYKFLDFYYFQGEYFKTVDTVQSVVCATFITLNLNPNQNDAEFVRMPVIRDNYILEKSGMIDHYKDQDTIYKSGEFHDSTVPIRTKHLIQINKNSVQFFSNTGISGRDVESIQTYFNTASSSLDTGKKNCAHSRENMSKEIFTIFSPKTETKPESENPNIHEKIEKKEGNCIERVINQYSQQICSAGYDIKALFGVKDLTESGLPKLSKKELSEISDCSIGRMYHAEFEYQFIFKIKMSLSKSFVLAFGRDDCGSNLPLYLSGIFKHYIEPNNKNRYIENANYYANDFLPIHEAFKTNPDLMSLERFYKSFEYIIFKYGAKKSINNHFVPVGIDYYGNNSRYTYPTKYEIFEKYILISQLNAKDITMADLNCLARSDLRFIFPLHKKDSERLAILTYGNISFPNDEGTEDINVILRQATTVKLPEKNMEDSISYTIGDIPYDDYYFIEVNSYGEKCQDFENNDPSTLGLDPNMNCNFELLLRRGYTIYYPKIDINGKPIEPPTNLQFQFPFFHNICMATRFWVKFKFDRRSQEKQDFCNSHNLRLECLKKKSKILLRSKSIVFKKKQKKRHL